MIYNSSGNMAPDLIIENSEFIQNSVDDFGRCIIVQSDAQMDDTENMSFLNCLFDKNDTCTFWRSITVLTIAFRFYDSQFYNNSAKDTAGHWGNFRSLF